MKHLRPQGLCPGAVLGARETKIKALADLVFGEDLFPGSWQAFLLCPHMKE